MKNRQILGCLVIVMTLLCASCSSLPKHVPPTSGPTATISSDGEFGLSILDDARYCTGQKIFSSDGPNVIRANKLSTFLAYRSDKGLIVFTFIPRVGGKYRTSTMTENKGIMNTIVNGSKNYFVVMDIDANKPVNVALRNYVMTPILNTDGHCEDLIATSGEIGVKSKLEKANS